MPHHLTEARRGARHCDIGNFAKRITLNVGKWDNSFGCH
jgi:hypothetical protein